MSAAAANFHELDEPAPVQAPVQAALAFHGRVLKPQAMTGSLLLAGPSLCINYRAARPVEIR